MKLHEHAVSVCCFTQLNKNSWIGKRYVMHLTDLCLSLGPPETDCTIQTLLLSPPTVLVSETVPEHSPGLSHAVCLFCCLVLVLVIDCHPIRVSYDRFSINHPLISFDRSNKPNSRSLKRFMQSWSLNNYCGTPSTSGTRSSLLGWRLISTHWIPKNWTITPWSTESLLVNWRKVCRRTRLYQSWRNASNRCAKSYRSSQTSATQLWNLVTGNRLKM